MFLDESGINLAMARRYGRAPKGQRVHGAVPKNYGQSVSLLGALGYRGLRAMMTVVGPVDGAVFLIYLRHVLGPRLRPGDILVMDNLAVHRLAEVAAALSQLPAQPQLHYLPAYSPDFNPIEHCWSKLKTALRAAAHP